MLALSTCWQSPFEPSGAGLVQKIKALGFDRVELEYRIGSRTFSELKPTLESGDLKAVSIHNYFPNPQVSNRPGGLPAWSFSSTDTDERETAIAYTSRAIAIAAEIGAQAVVVHCGEVEMDPRLDELKRIYDTGGISSRAGAGLIGEIKKERAEKLGGPLDRVLSCLDRLAKTCADGGVRLGLENRYHGHEIPNSNDLSYLLHELEGAPVGYWHDCGHAAVQENLDLDSQAALLGRFRDRLIGIHLHDVSGYTDHLAPGTGEVDFAFIKENIPGSAIQVLEVRPGTSKPEMIGGVAHLREAGIS